MKFETYFASNLYEPWRTSYLSYGNLKKLVSALGDKSHALYHNHVLFITQMEVELAKIDQHYKSHFGMLLSQIDRNTLQLSSSRSCIITGRQVNIRDEEAHILFNLFCFARLNQEGVRRIVNRYEQVCKVKRTERPADMIMPKAMTCKFFYDELLLRLINCCNESVSRQKLKMSEHQRLKQQSIAQIFSGFSNLELSLSNRPTEAPSATSGIEASISAGDMNPPGYEPSVEPSVTEVSTACPVVEEDDSEFADILKIPSVNYDGKLPPGGKRSRAPSRCSQSRSSQSRMMKSRDDSSLVSSYGETMSQIAPSSTASSYTMSQTTATNAASRIVVGSRAGEAPFSAPERCVPMQTDTKPTIAPPGDYGSGYPGHSMDALNHRGAKRMRQDHEAWSTGLPSLPGGIPAAPMMQKKETQGFPFQSTLDLYNQSKAGPLPLYPQHQQHQQSGPLDAKDKFGKLPTLATHILAPPVTYGVVPAQITPNAANMPHPVIHPTPITPGHNSVDYRGAPGRNSSLAGQPPNQKMTLTPMPAFCAQPSGFLNGGGLINQMQGGRIISSALRPPTAMGGKIDLDQLFASSSKKKRYKGIRRTSSNKWVARIEHNGQQKHLGTYRTAAEAAMVYDRALYQVLSLTNPEKITLKRFNFPDRIVLLHSKNPNNMSQIHWQAIMRRFGRSC